MTGTKRPYGSYGGGGLILLLALSACQSEPVTEHNNPSAGPPMAPAPHGQTSTPANANAKAQAQAKSNIPSDIAALDAETRRIAAAACRAEEETIFYCKIANGKPLSVCATKDRMGEYRYGGSHPELVLHNGSWAVDRFSRGGESQIRFMNGDTSYTVFSRMVSTSVEEGGSGPAISDGVVIERRDKVLALRLCEGKQAQIPINYNAADRAFGDPQDIFTGATAQADGIE